MITADKLKFRDLTIQEKEIILEFLTKKRRNYNLIISIIILLVFTSHFMYYVTNNNISNIFNTIIFYTILIIIAFIPFINYYTKKMIRIHRIKTNNVKCVKAVCPYGKYYSHSRKRVNNRPVYEITTEFESRMVIQPYSVYGKAIKANSEFYIIKFGEKDTIYLN